MPSSQSKLQVKQAAIVPNAEIWITSRYDDLSILSKYLWLIKYLNDIKNEDKSYQADYTLEVTLINFI